MTSEPISLHDVFTEADASPDTLANLGPLRPLAGTWSGRGGTDDHPIATGDEIEGFTETYDLQPLDAQTNGPQLFYGLRYHQHITRVNDVEMFHDQVGYLLWEPAEQRVIMTLAIPRGQIAMARGTVTPDAKTFTLIAKAGSPYTDITSNEFLDEAFHTASWSITFTIHDDDSWSYDQTTMLDIQGNDKPFRHTDTSTLTRVAPPTPNPLALAADGS